MRTPAPAGVNPGFGSKAEANLEGWRQDMANAKQYSSEEIQELLKDGAFTLTDVIDAVIEINAIIGVGLISLGEDIERYIINQS